jgi:putative two-component system response regulator
MRKDIIQNSRILIIDDRPENVLLLKRMLTEAGYQQLRTLTDSRKALAEFTEFSPDLVILDLQMPYVSGLDLLKQLRSRVPETDFVPVLVVTADNTRKAKQDALSLSAKDFIAKPLDRSETLLRIHNLLESRWLHVELRSHNETLESMVQERTRQLEEAQLEILERLARAAEYRDDCTGQHTQRVGAMAALLARQIGLPAEHAELIRRAAPLHDIGKIGIPDRVLLKPGRLTAEEYAHIKTHTDIGRIILSGSKFAILQLAEKIALYHHERWDGEGYYRLQGPAIPIEARIVSIVDAFDVITHTRPYKEAEAVDTALASIRSERERQFDPLLVDAFFEMHGDLQLNPDILRLESALSAEVAPQVPVES